MPVLSQRSVILQQLKKPPTESKFMIYGDGVFNNDDNGYQYRKRRKTFVRDLKYDVNGQTKGKLSFGKEFRIHRV